MCVEEKHARGGELRLGDADLRLDHRVVAQERSTAGRRLALSQCDEGIQRAARNAERDRGKARPEELVNRE